MSAKDLYDKIKTKYDELKRQCEEGDASKRGHNTVFAEVYEDMLAIAELAAALSEGKKK